LITIYNIALPSLSITSTLISVKVYIIMILYPSLRAEWARKEEGKRGQETLVL